MGRAAQANRGCRDDALAFLGTAIAIEVSGAQLLLVAARRALAHRLRLGAVARSGASSKPEETFVTLSLGRLFRLRLVVARQGEMDAARWWSTGGVLGRHGSIVLSRDFPRTQGFIQARVAFAVARARCSELLDAPRAITLWNLPAWVEDQFEADWHTWLDAPEAWQEVFAAVSEPSSAGILDRLSRFHLMTPTTLALVANLQPSADGRAIPLPDTHEPDDEILTALAAAFSLAEPGRLAVPFVRLRD